jgi:hypothetical protein
MSDFETFECVECRTEFKALADANAARTGYCSPACETSAEELA